MDEVWCGLDLQLQAGDIDALHHHHHRGPAPDLHGHHGDPFWPALAECAASFLAGDDTAGFAVADIDLIASAKAAAAAADAMDTDSFFADDNDDDHHLTTLQDEQQQPVYSSSSLSSKRSLSIDSGGSSSTFFPLDDTTAVPAAAGIFYNSPPQHPAPPPQQKQQDPLFAGDDEAIMLAMMAVLSSSASPSSSESSSPPHHRPNAVQQPRLHQLHGGDSSGHVKVRSSSLAAVVGPERTTAGDAAARQQQEGSNNNNSSQLYHMMSERKRREKLNDSFHTLRTLLPPCSKKDKTTVLMNAASYLKTLEAQVSELEEKNTKLERYVPRENSSSAGVTHRRAKVHIVRDEQQQQQNQVVMISLTVMVIVECDIVDLVLHVLERLRWMPGVTVLSVDADTYSPQALLKALANIKLRITEEDCGWDEKVFHEAMTKAVHEATTASSSSSSSSGSGPSPPASCAAAAVAPLVAAV